MKKDEFYEKLTLYDINQMRKNPKKLIYLTENKDFVEAFRVVWNKELFHYYGTDLDEIFKEAVANGDVIRSEITKLHSIFKDHLPNLIIREIAHFVSEDIFF